jgi:hypothetical protein
VLEVEVKEKNRLISDAVRWLQRMADPMPLADRTPDEALRALIASMDAGHSPMARDLARIRDDARFTHEGLVELVEAAARMGFVPETLDWRGDSSLELVEVIHRAEMAIDEKLGALREALDRQKADVVEARDVVRRVARVFGVKVPEDAEALDMDDICRQITLEATRLADGESSHFISVGVVDELTLPGRTAGKIREEGPRLYLPQMCEYARTLATSVEGVIAVGEPLRAIFKTFDFGVSVNFDPKTEMFKFLRDEIYKMHLALGSEQVELLDARLRTVVQRFVSLASSLVSFIAGHVLGSSITMEVEAARQLLREQATPAAPARGTGLSATLRQRGLSPTIPR